MVLPRRLRQGYRRTGVQPKAENSNRGTTGRTVDNRIVAIMFWCGYRLEQSGLPGFCCRYVASPPEAAATQAGKLLLIRFRCRPGLRSIRRLVVSARVLSATGRR